MCFSSGFVLSEDSSSSSGSDNSSPAADIIESQLEDDIALSDSLLELDDASDNSSYVTDGMSPPTEDESVRHILFGGGSTEEE